MRLEFRKEVRQKRLKRGRKKRCEKTKKDEWGRPASI